jgi:glycosyltransferase involved in cell wall biosynthesis
MRILVLAPLSPKTGGMVKQISKLIIHLKMEGLFIITLDTQSKIRRKQFLIRLKDFTRWFNIQYNLIKLNKKYDCLFIHTSSYLSYWLITCPSIITAKLIGKKIIVEYRGGKAKEFFKIPFNYSWIFLKYINMLIVPSGFLYEVFLEKGINSIVIPNAIYNTNKVNKSKDNNIIKQIVMIRALQYVYRIDLAIKAFSLVLKEHPNCCLKIAGDGPLKKELIKQCKLLNIKENVKFTGSLNEKEIDQILTESDILLNTNDNDNMPNSILEAFYYGIPVISTNVGGIPYIAKHEETALLVEKGDYNDIAKQIVRLLEDNKIKDKLIKNAKKYVRSFQWCYIKDKWIETFNSL